MKTEPASPCIRQTFEREQNLARKAGHRQGFAKSLPQRFVRNFEQALARL